MYISKPHNIYCDKTELLIKTLKMLGEGLVLMGLILALYAWTIIGAAMLGVL